MTDTEKEICKYGQRKDQEALQQYIEKLDVDQITSVIQNRLTSPNFSHVWNYLLQAFTDSSKSHEKRFRVASTFLHELEKGALSSTQCSILITRLCIELPKFKPRHLIDLCNFCIECIQRGNVTEMCWKEVLPELLNVLVKCEHVEYNDTEMTGLEYKTQLINSICMLVWSPSILTSLSSMFIDMPLTKEEHFQVVNKLGQYMEKLTCQEIPAFVYQLLKLCRNQNCRSVILRLQYYFGTRIYSKVNLNPNSNSESSNNMDVIGDATDQEAVEVESTVLFHIYQSATVNSEIIKDYLASLKNMAKSPEFVLHPFQFTVLLTISSVSAYEERVMEILRLCISRALQEEQKKIESCWFREMVPSTCKIEDILRQIIDCGLADRHLVVEGLVRLAYVLLGVGAMLGRDGDVIAEKQWFLGKMILLKIIKKKRQIAPCIIKSLSVHIVTGHNVFQYIDCINILSQKMLLIMLENQSCVIQLIEYLVEVPGPVANQLFDAVLPLTKVSPTIRDHLILLLRKSLYSRKMETRQMAVSGFLKLIKNLKISNLAAISQSSSSSSQNSGHSLLTQVSLNCSGTAAPSAFSNEALCLEVLGILRRCFMQQAEVRSQLYDGLYDAVCMNPELGIPVLDVMWVHFNKFYVTDEDSLPPLHFSKITVTKNLDVKQEEPIGKLIYAVGLIVTKVREDDEENATITRFTTAMESLCSRMISCELINFELDDGTDLLDTIPESQHKLIVLKEAVSVYEALIGYKICSWGPQSENNGQQISSLFQGYSRLLDFSKNLMKPKKVDKKKKKDDGRTTQQSQNTTKMDSTTKSSKTFKLSTTVMDFQTIGKILHLLHKSRVSWATTAQTNIIKTKHDFHRYMMQATIQLVQKLKGLRTVEVQHTKMYFNYMTEIAGILYARCIARLTEFIDFDCTTAILAVECFHLILVVICTHYRNQLPAFLSTVAGKSKDEELVNILKIFIETYEQLFELDEEETSSDPEIKKLSLLVVNTITLLSSHIPTGGNLVSVQLLDWLKNVMNNNTLANKQVASSFVNLTFNAHIKFKTTVNLFEAVALRLSNILGTVNEDKPDTTEPRLIDATTVTTVFSLFCSSVKTMLDDIDWIISRLRAEYAMISYPGEDNPERRREYLKSKERGVCCHLCPIITILGTLCNITVPIGNLSEALLKNVSHMYSLLNSLTKYFILRSSKINVVFQGARFEQVVRLAGKQLCGVVYDYIIYIEEANKQEIENSQTKKKPVDSTTLKSKVLRETRLIPKVVYEIEQFGKSVIQLSKKTKVDLTKYIGQGTARDFRIKGLKQVLEHVGNETNITNDENEDSGTSDANDVSNESKNGAGTEEESDGPPRKRSKK